MEYVLTILHFANCRCWSLFEVNYADRALCLVSQSGIIERDNLAHGAEFFVFLISVNSHQVPAST